MEQAQNIPVGEKQLLHYIIYILAFVVIPALVSVVVYLYLNREKLHTKYRDDVMKCNTDLIVHTQKNNEVMANLAGVIKENTDSSQSVRETFLELKQEIKAERELKNDFFPDLLRALNPEKK